MLAYPGRSSRDHRGQLLWASAILRRPRLLSRAGRWHSWAGVQLRRRSRLLVAYEPRFLGGARAVDWTSWREPVFQSMPTERFHTARWALEWAHAAGSFLIISDECYAARSEPFGSHKSPHFSRDLKST